MSRRKHHRPGNPITAWADLMPFVIGGAMTSYMMPHPLKLLTKGKFTMTAMEKACSTLLVVVLQKLDDMETENAKLRDELASLRDHGDRGYAEMLANRDKLAGEVRELKEKLSRLGPPRKARRKS